MKLFDTHVHLDAVDHMAPEEAFSRAQEAGIEGMVAVGGSPDANAFALQSATPAGIWAAVGYDRDRTSHNDSMGVLEDQLTDPESSPVAIGEIGLDYHYLPESADLQVDLFNRQLEIASRHRLPVIVHSREAAKQTLSILGPYAEKWGEDRSRIGVLHCFSGGPDFARAIADTGFYISFSGIVTFKKADEVRAAVLEVPEDRLVIETDSPLLAPEPLRGQRNEPANLVHVAEKIAEIKGWSLERTAEVTTANARRLFGLASCPKNSSG